MADEKETIWSKIKTAFSVVGAFFTVAILSVCIFFIRRSGSDGRGSTGNDGGNGGIGDRITGSEAGIGRAEEHIGRAKEILRRAVERGKEKKDTALDPDGNG